MLREPGLDLGKQTWDFATGKPNVSIYWVNTKGMRMMLQVLRAAKWLAVILDGEVLKRASRGAVVVMMASAPITITAIATIATIAPVPAQAETVGGGSGSNGGGSVSGRQAGGDGKCQISAAEARCACKENFGQTLAEQLWSDAKNDRSGGKCMKGVRQGFQDACGVKDASWACQAAADAGDCFKKLGFTRHEGNAPMPSPPKPGTVYVFEGGDWGHIEVYTGTQKEGKATYCSDYCTNKRRDVQSPSARKLDSWWEPPDGESPHCRPR